MKIITIPNQHLRQKAKPIEVFDKKLFELVAEMAETLNQTKSPHGVALAAPQVDKLVRVLVTSVADENDPRKGGKKLSPRAFINPIITKHSLKVSLGANKKNPDFEGCLSMPKIWGPVPRWEWVDLEYQTIDENGTVVTKKDHFQDYFARVLQHEIDHFEGVLFTDYALKYELPVYLENSKGDFEEIDDYSLLESF